MDVFGRIIAIILAIVMIILYPLQYVAVNQKNIIDNRVEYVTQSFTNNIMSKGYLTLDMYNDFTEKLAETNQLYDIDIIHSKEKDGINVGCGNGIQDKNNLYKNMSSVKVLNNSKNNISTSGMIKKVKLEDSSENDYTIKSLSTHTHTDDCYAGHRHGESGCTSLGNIYVGSPEDNLYARTLDAHDDGYETTQSTIIEHNYGNSILLIGNTIYDNNNSIDRTFRSTVINYYSIAQFYLDDSLNIGGKMYYIYQYLTSDTQLDSSWQYAYYDSNTGKNVYKKYNLLYNTIQSIQNSLYGSYTVFSGSTEYTELKDLGFFHPEWSDPYHMKDGSMPRKLSSIWSCGLQQDETPICDRVVTNIVATNPNQTIKKGENIITTAAATYLDGHTGNVNCTVSGFDSNTIGTQTATLTYSGLVNNAKTTGTKTCTVNVTVKSNKLPISLTVTPSSDTVYNGSEPTYTVKVNYDDGSSAIITTGYTKTGFTIGAGTKTVTFTYTENGVTVSKSIVITVKRNIKICPYGHSYELDDFDTDNGCPICKTLLKSIEAAPDELTVEKGGSLNINITATYYDEHIQLITNGWTSDFDSNQLGEQLVTVKYGGMTDTVNVTVTQKLTCPICGSVYPANKDGTDPGCPICSKSVKSITATPDSQTVSIGENPIIEVTATYLDGHKAVVTDWTSNFNAFQVGRQNVVIYYQSRSIAISVTVISKDEITCPICGTVYSRIEHPNGCPICSNTVVGIEAYLRNGGTQVQYGSELNLYIVLIYKDKHTELAYNDWSVKGYQADVLGMQKLTVTYKDFSTTLTIEVIDSLTKSDNSGGQDTLDEDAKSFMECIYTKDILNQLYKTSIYYLNSGDYITVTVRLLNISIYVKLENMFHLVSADTDYKKYSYGGMVDGEDI